MPVAGWWRSLTVRVMVFLSLALMPLGAISVWQTNRISAQAAEEAEITLLSLTEHAANPLQAVLQRAYGAATGLGPRILTLAEDPSSCQDTLRRFVEETSGYSEAAYIPVSGLVECSSTGSVVDVSEDPALRRSLGDERPSVTQSEDGQSVVVKQPLRDDADVLLGFLSLSIPTARLSARDLAVSDQPLRLVTFNDRGDVLAVGTASDPESAADMLPSDRTLAELAQGGERSFRAPDGTGEERVFAVVAIVPQFAYALSSWPNAFLPTGNHGRTVLPSLLPVLMWISSLLVAVLALERLVFRPVRLLGRQMNTFARSRRLPAQARLSDAGTEIGAIEADFRHMAQSILQDEARQEDSLREKNMLLKEVHHRVKNNLQLISSIMNMQARNLVSREAKDVLRRVQDRVMGLAAVHRSLYQRSDFGRIDAGAVVAELAEQIAAAAREGRSTDMSVEVDEVFLDPDEAVTLSLLVSEAMTNAVSRVDRIIRAGGAAEIRLRLTSGDGTARLVLSNPTDVDEGGPAEGDGNVRGLGGKLIQAFARQLGGKVQTTVEGGTYLFELTFPTSERRGAPLDY